MKKFYIGSLFMLFMIVFEVGHSQTYNMNNTAVNTCSGTFYDSGGTGDYASSEDFTKTFTPSTAGQMLQFVFTAFSTESCCDYLQIYDGPTIASPLIGQYQGATSPGTITATNISGALTFVWHSDGSIINTGWVATLSCVAPPPTYLMDNGAPTVNTCTGFFMDPQGTSDYIDNAGTFTKTICSDNGQSIRFTFTDFETREAADYLRIYNGPTTGSPVIGTYSLTTSPGVIVSSGTCLTFEWTTDNNGAARLGWASTISCIPSPPSNDECAFATPLTVNGDYACGTVTAGTVLNSTASAQANTCFGTDDDDVWFSFVATATTHRVSLLNVAGSVTDMYHVVYGGTCGSLTEILCSDGDVSNPSGLTIGNTYYVRVYTYTSTPGQTSTFNICIGSPPPPPPNDNCAGAIALTVNGDQLCGVVTPSYTQSATNSGIAGCTGTADDDVWFSFTATSTSHDFSLLNITGTSTDMVHEIFSGNCGSPFSIACSDPNTSLWGGFTIGQTYYVRVYTYSSGTTLYASSFDICVGTPPPPPTNDDPCGAIALNVNAGSCSYQTAVLGTSTTATPGIPAPGCSSLGPDVWFTAVVPASGRLIIDMSAAGGPTDMGMAWYTAPSCAGPFTLIECDDDDSQNGALSMICRTGVICTVPGDCQQNATLTPGTVVYVRIWEYGGGTFGPFDICAYEPSAPGAPSTCASSTLIGALPYTDNGQTTCCRANTVSTAQGCASSYQGGEDFLYRYVPSVNQTIDITVTGTLSNTGVFVTNGCPTSGGTCVASATSVSGNPLLCGVNLIAGNTYYIMIDNSPSPTCTPFNISISTSSTPSCGLNYSVASIGFSPDLNAGTDIALPIDDRFSSSYIPIGFPFCFDGFQWTQLLVSSNGYVIFNPIGCASNLPSTNAAPSATSSWPIDYAIPNTNQAPRNCIMFPWQDINPAVGGTIRYQVLGTAPNRRFVLTYTDVPYFDCTSLLFTGQLKLFETTNNIEVHIDNNEICSSWNNGAAILGLHNYNGTLAVVPAGHNYPNQWDANNDAWRFTCNCATCIALPVELIEFTGESIRTNVNQLNWRTASELNNDRFEIERLATNGEFEYIGKVPGKGNSNEVLSYGFTDLSAPEGIAYYRLKQVDYNGEFHYSQTIVVDPNHIEGVQIMITPNPATNSIEVMLKSKLSNASFELISSTGVEFILQKGLNTDGKSEFSYDVSTYPRGIYMFIVRGESGEVLSSSKVILR